MPRLKNNAPGDSELRRPSCFFVDYAERRWLRRDRCPWPCHRLSLLQLLTGTSQHSALAVRSLRTVDRLAGGVVAFNLDAGRKAAGRGRSR